MSDRFRTRTAAAGLFPPQGLKFAGFQGLCMGGLDAYNPVMVLSTCGADVTPHSQSHMTFARRTESGKEGASVPFPNPSYPVRPIFGQGDPYSLSSPLLSLHHPLLAGHALGRSYLNGAFRPLGLPPSDDRSSTFQGSAFAPAAKCFKLDNSEAGSQSLLLSYQGSEPPSFRQQQSPAATSMPSSYLDGKEDSDSMADRETPILSEESRSIETPEDRGTPKRGPKKFFADGQTPYCPICGNQVQLSELSAHYEFEVDKLLEMSKCISQQLEVSSLHSPFSSPLCVVRKDEKSKPESRWETYQRVKGNRTTRLGSARCLIKRKKWEEDSREDQMVRFRKQQHEVDSAADFNWAVTARLHAIATLQRNNAFTDFTGRKMEEDESQELNVDGDDSATYGQPHYTEADVITCSTEEEDNKDQIRRIKSNDSNQFHQRHSSDGTKSSSSSQVDGQEVVTSTCASNCDGSSEKASTQGSKDAKETMEDGIKCLICMESFIKPVVSICCWHVHCEECWLKTLGSKKLCPQCNMITSARDLRRIYL